ncbi:invasion associated locus B family protein [Shinella sp.]|uniref:invasion associated locus B family protein n=1 Tax=Shinella sp. TaxID=1870904 RepID=UPI00301D4EBC
MRQKHRSQRKSTTLAVAFAAIAGMADAAPLPGGANSLVETYDDWGVVCQVAGNVASCLTRQVQSNNQTQQVVLTAEIARLPTGKFAGALMLPLGLSLAQGAQLKIGDAPLGGVRAFSVCLPQGCLVPLDITDDVIAKLKAGNALNVDVTASAPARPLTFTVSLKGLSGALNRVNDLTK